MLNNSENIQKQTHPLQTITASKSRTWDSLVSASLRTDRTIPTVAFGCLFLPVDEHCWYWSWTECICTSQNDWHNLVSIWELVDDLKMSSTLKEMENQEMPSPL